LKEKIQIKPTFVPPNIGLGFVILLPDLKSCSENNTGLSINHKQLIL